MVYKKRKILSVIALAAVFCMLLSGCRQEQPGSAEPTQVPTQTTAPLETAQPAETTQPAGTVTELPPAAWNTVPDIDASYEQWLAAAMIMIVPMEYPDFEILGIYAASETAVTDCESSLGTYIHFRSDGRELLLHSAPLTGERKEPGTMDLYTSQLGFASFDLADLGGVDLGAMSLLDMADLAQVVDYSLLVSLYSR